MGNQTSQWGKDFKADTERSTYRWIIFFTNGKQINGYSRKADKPEIQDKVRLLKRKIIMLTKSSKNYFDANTVSQIEFYQRTNLGEYKDHLFTLFPSHYMLHSNAKFNTHEPIISFLNTMYDLISIGNIGQLDYKMVGYSKIKEDDLFSLDRSFRDVSELQKWCNDRLIEGFPFERVNHFKRQVLQKFTEINFKIA